MLKNTLKIMIMSAVFLMISGWAVAGELEPPSGPAPTMKSLQEIYNKLTIGTEITSLPYEIDSPGFYFITQDLTCPEGTHGITITTDNVTLDLMGFNLVGPGTDGSEYYDGVHMQAKTNVEIRNGTVSGFSGNGIYGSDSYNGGHRIINVRARNNGGDGIHLSGASHLVKGCTAESNGNHGIWAGKGSTVTGNTVNSNGSNGISTNLGSTVTGNNVHLNSGHGILAETGSTVTGNTAYNNGLRGIYSYNGSAVVGNTASFNSYGGIFLTGECLVDQNVAYLNGGDNINDCATSTFGTNFAP